MLLQMASFHSFLWLSNIPLYIYTPSSLFTCWWLLGCFDVSAIVNSAAVNFGMYVSFQIRVFHRYMSKNGIAESYNSSIFRFFEEPQFCFPYRLNQFIVSSRVWEDSLFCTPFPAFVIWRLFDEGHFDWFEMISHSFDLNFSNN